jgi:bacterioferritin (cytochrome b1)
MSKEDLIKGLNEDLAAELGAVIRYTYQSAKTVGFVGAELRELLEDEIADELGMRPS